jgi:hypothetical protein
MKKTLLILGGLSLFALVPHSFAAEVNNGFVALTNIPGLTDPAVANQGNFALFLNNLYKYLIGVAAILAVVEIIWGGLEISTQDSVSKHAHGKERIQEAILGLVLVLSPALVFSIINPNIINLSLNLPPLDINLINNTAPNGAGGPSITAPATGCTTQHSGPYLERAVCASQSSAQSYTCQNDLNLTIPSCRSMNPNTNTCADTRVTVYCQGKTATVVHYYNTHFFGLFAGSDEKVIPRDAPIENAFKSACASDGGVVPTATGIGSNYDCPADANIPNFDTAEQSGVQCMNAALVCKPPNN